MKILYIHPDTSELRDSQITIPIGIVSLSYLIQQLDVEYKGINIPVEKSIDSNFSLENYIKMYNPDLVLIDLQWMIYSYKSIEIANIVKNIKPKCIVVLGGITATIYADEILKKFDSIDYITRGFTEECTIQLIESILNHYNNIESISNLSYKKNNVVINNPISQINQNDYYHYDNYDFLEHYDYMLERQSNHVSKDMIEKLAWIPTGRGCSYNCSYCGGNKNMFKKEYCNNKTIPYDPRNIVECMEKLHKKYRIKYFGITHDFSIFSKKYCDEIFSEMKKMSFKPVIYNYLFQLPDKEYFEEFLKVINHNNSIIGLPVVCGNEKYRRLNGKKFNNKELFSFLDFMSNYEVNIELYFIANPYYGSDTYEESLELMEIILKKYKDKMNLRLSCGFEIIQPESKKQFKGKTCLSTFEDFYYRYSPQFLKDIKNNKNINYLTGEKEYDSLLYNRIVQAKELINKYE